MARNNYSYEKRQRELAKKKKKEEKLLKKRNRKLGIEDESEELSDESVPQSGLEGTVETEGDGSTGVVDPDVTT